MTISPLRATARLSPAIAALALLAACSSGSAAAPASSSVPAASTPASSGAGPAGAVYAACSEVTRVSHEVLKGLADQDPSHWDAFAVALQSVANGTPDPAFRAAATDLATAALAAADGLKAGTPLGTARAKFDDAVPAVDTLCKKAGAPLN